MHTKTSGSREVTTPTTNGLLPEMEDPNVIEKLLVGDDILEYVNMTNQMEQLER